MLKLEKIPDKTINRIIWISVASVMLILTVWRLIPILSADAAKRATEIMSIPVPTSASDIHFSDQAGFHGGNYFISMKVPQADFLDITKTLQFTNQSDLFEAHPEALISTNLDWWKVSHSNDTNTFYGERRIEFSWVVMRYEDGRLYYHRHMLKTFGK